MWKSPIDIFRTDVQVQMEGEIMKAVHEFAPYVDKDELLKLLKNDRESYETGYDDGYDDGFNKSKWIPCGLDMPDYGQKVLIQYDDGSHDIARFWIAEGRNFCGFKVGSMLVHPPFVKAWCPIEPYREE